MTDRRFGKRLLLSFSVLSVPVLIQSVVLTQEAGAQTVADTTGRTAVKTASKAKARSVATTRSATTAQKTAQNSAATGATAVPATTVPATARVSNAATVRSAGRVAAAPRQDSPENIVVTGSFLRSNRLTSPNPVQIITAKDIQKTSAQNLGDYLARIPSIGSSGTPNSQTNGGGGVSCTDLRNMGQERVLILIDGKRTAVNAGTDCVDLNTIPVQQIDSVEILKDGGSELYGADAVSGVINVKLKHNINTGNIFIKGGISEYGDGEQGLISGMKGFNFDHDKGNVTVFGSYNTQSGIRQKNRAWAANPQLTNDPGVTPTYGSSVIPAGTITGTTTDIGALVSNQDGGQNGIGNSFHEKTSADRYNYGKDTMLTNTLQMANLSGDAHYDINKHFTLYSTIRYSHNTTQTQLAGAPVSGSIPPSTLLSSWIIPEGNPYNPFGQDVNLSRRMTEFGPRRESFATDTWTTVSGVKGEITHGWMYDASMTYGESRVKDQMENLGNYAHMLQESGTRQLDPSDPDSAVVYDPTVCTSQPGCVLQNPFSPMSAQARKYGMYTSYTNSQYMLRDFNLRINNDKVVKLPYEGGGDVGIALGMEHRSEQLNSVPDAITASGQGTGNSASYSGGGFNANEVYMEGNIPLLHNAFLAKDLLINGQGRWSDYNTFGSTQNWKVGITWAPTRDVHFHATLGTSYRQPSVYDLYSGANLGYYSAVDPCAQVSTYGASAGAVTARCMGQGVNPATFVDQNVGQIPGMNGGNAKLRPETGKTYTIGATVTPRWIPGLTASVDFWHYYLKNQIQSIGAQYLLNQCYTGADTSYCSFINPRSSSGQLTSVDLVPQNIGGMKTSGLDFDLNYSIAVSPNDILSLQNNFQQLISYLQQYTAGGQWYNYAGQMFYQGGSAQPRVRDYATATWRHGNFRLTYMMQYIGGTTWTDGSQILTRQTAGQWKTPGIFTHDVTLEYRLHQWDFQVGVNNLLDKKPPFVLDSASNTNIYQYGGLEMGRYAWASIGLDF
ncbi:TonB-dependent receptor [Acetobacter musti]|uniref:TonB-dependent receptor n=1 Tax=Acetobacter musti TaxID=864732 RepID=A0ABX0JN08_9PROT|nr:TonB-dependent receptor [Acetobacter musti]NHN84010.1 TonB-dependent receptor [Acetobacter musti]